mgnify:CR=1 FL=1
MRWTVCKNKNRTTGQCLMTAKSSSSNGKLYLSGGYIMTVLIIFIDALLIVLKRRSLFSLIVLLGILIQGIIQLIYNMLPTTMKEIAKVIYIGDVEKWN